MNCKETQKIIMGGPSQCSRAERAAVYAHLRDCMGCTFFTADNAPPEHDRERLKEAKIFLEDMADPEFRSTVYGDTHEKSVHPHVDTGKLPPTGQNRLGQ